MLRVVILDYKENAVIRNNVQGIDSSTVRLLQNKETNIYTPSS